MGQLENMYPEVPGGGSRLTVARFRVQRWLSRPEKIMGLILLAVLIILALAFAGDGRLD